MLKLYTLSYNHTLIKGGEEVQVFNIVGVSPDQITEETESWVSPPDYLAGTRISIKVNNKRVLMIAMTSSQIRYATEIEKNA